MTFCAVKIAFVLLAFKTYSKIGVFIADKATTLELEEMFRHCILLPFLLAAFCGSKRTVCGTNTDQVQFVHIVFMNHLDVGYADLANAILNKYFEPMGYFAQAAELGQQLTDGGYVETFKYMTHPWLVSLFLNCPPNLVMSGIQLKCPTTTQVQQFKNAVKAGYITWHAGPMNLQPENNVDWLFKFGLQISHDLDDYFGINRSMRVLSQRDVPGMTQAVIPSLLQMGVTAISVGVNPTTPPPAVPNLFRWQFNGQEVLATYHPGGYPNNPGPNPSNPGGLSVKDCVIVPDFPHALCFAFRTDNSGPPQSMQELLGFYEILRVEFPNAQLRASSFEEYFVQVNAIRDKLPVVTQEISDTWIQGIASDPRKLAEFRAVARVLGDCISKGVCSLKDKRVYNASVILVKLSEHTWGLDSVRDSVNWSNEAFYRVKRNPNYVKCELSWLEQRNYTYLAIDALQDHPVVKSIAVELQQLQPNRPDLTDFTPLLPSQWSKIFGCSNGVSIGFNADGSIGTLNYNSTKWASSLNPLGQFVYQTFNEEDFNVFDRLYSYSGGNPGYSKTNVTANAHPERMIWPVAMKSFYIRNDQSCDFHVQLQLLDDVTWFKYGAPKSIWVHYLSLNKPGVNITVQWFDKTSTRLPESIMMNFKPIQPSNSKWRISKLGQLVDPLNVILNGSQRQHGADDDGAVLLQNIPLLDILSPDVAIICPITNMSTALIFPFPLRPIEQPVTGIGFNLYNNIWDTNWIFWYPFVDADRDMKFRFSVVLNT